MKKFMMVVIALLYSLVGANMVFAAADSWTRKADFGGTVRYTAVGFSIGSKGYIGTGFVYTPQSGSQRSKDFWEYDPANDTWTQKADFGGEARTSAAGFSIGNKGYIGTGNIYILGTTTSQNVKDFWEYDPALNVWTRKADFGGGNRIGAVGFSIGNKGYMGLGVNSSTSYKDFWEYDPATDTWTRKADFGGTARSNLVGFSIGNKGYAGTGQFYDYSNSLSTYYKDFWEYDPDADAWKQMADFGGAARYRAAGLSISNKGYIGVGKNSSNQTDFWEYDPATNAWTKRADFGGGSKVAPAVFVIGNKGYMGTGIAGMATYTKDFWEYEPIDTTPDQFIFNYETGVDLNTTVTSNAITVSGINSPAPISITGGTYSINNGPYTSASGTVNDGDIVTVQLKSSGSSLTTTVATLSIGGVSDTFSVTTKEATSIITLNPVADKTTLWPPNNKLIPVTIQANAKGSAGEPLTLTAKVSCNESAKRGVDWTEPVINQKTGVIKLSLRATRSGFGTGRIYTITITATAGDGRFATKSVIITVPHDQGNQQNGFLPRFNLNLRR